MFTKETVYIYSINWKDDVPTLTFDNGDSWVGPHLNDMWKIRDWKHILKEGVPIRLWKIKHSIIGFEMLSLKGEWIPVWCFLKENDL